MLPAFALLSSSQRFDWGWDDSGAISIFLATLIVANWGFACALRHGFGVSLGLTLLWGAGLVRYDASWGGIVGVLAGLSSLALWSYPDWSRGRIIATGMAFLVLVGVALFIPKNPAPPQKHGEENAPITSRLLIWKAVPHMLLDAPGGWGRSSPRGWDATGTGPAYLLGYQPFAEQVQEYRTLVNSHFTWLAERSWPPRILYVCAWAWVGALVWPPRKQRWFSVLTGIWMTEGIAGLFSPALTAPLTWIIPLTALVMALGFRLMTRTWPALQVWLLAPLGATIAFLLLIFVFTVLFPAQVPIRRQGDRTIIGYGIPSVWFIHPYVDVLGHHFGQGIRSMVLAARNAGHPLAVGIAPRLNEVDRHDEANILYVFSYKNISEALPTKARRLIFLNTWLTSSVSWPATRMGKKDMVLMGSRMFNNNIEGLAKDKDRWKQIQIEDPTFTLSVIAATGFYLPMPSWRDAVLGVIMEESAGSK